MIKLSKGKLKEFAQQKNLLTNITFLAESERENFADVRLITSKQFAEELAMPCAILEMLEADNESEQDMVDSIERIVEESYSYIGESIYIDDDMVNVVMNKEQISDHDVDYAFGMLVQLDAFDSGTQFDFINGTLIK